MNDMLFPYRHEREATALCLYCDAELEEDELDENVCSVCAVEYADHCEVCDDVLAPDELGLCKHCRDES